MAIRDNLSLSRLFISKQVTVFVNQTSFTVKIKTIKDFFEDDQWNAIYHLWTLPVEKAQQMLPIKINSPWEGVNTVLFRLGAYDKFREICSLFTKYISEILPDVNIDFATKEIRLKDIIMTDEIWEYILYILKYTQGEKVTKPLIFTSEEARQFYLAQKANEERIASIRKKNKNGDEDALAKMLLSITYAFPSLTIDYLCNQTMAQIQWLQKHAAGAVSYEVNAKAFAAGNMKKGKKLDFFLK